VFGTADTDVIELSSVTSGTGGFVINGEKAGDNSGFSVSSAGDVNGETEWPLRSQAFLPLITKPPVPAAMLDKSTAFVLLLPNTT
jgi:hypothetical protein